MEVHNDFPINKKITEQTTRPPLANAVYISDAILSTACVLTSECSVDLIPAMYLVFFNASSRVRDKQPQGSVYSNVLTTFMNFSLAAQGDGLQAGWVEKMRRPFDAADRTHTHTHCAPG